MRSVTFSILPPVDTPGANRQSGQRALQSGDVIEQLKNGVNAMRMPVDDLLQHWPTWWCAGETGSHAVKVPPVELDGSRRKRCPE